MFSVRVQDRVTAEKLDIFEKAGGKLRLDLTRLPSEPAPVAARLAIGLIEVVVPSCASLDMHAVVGAGTITVDGRSDSGFNVNRVIQVGANSPMRISIQVNIGSIEVDRVNYPKDGCPG